MHEKTTSQDLWSRERRRPLRVAAAASAIALALGLAACSSDSGGTETPGQGGGTQAAQGGNGGDAGNGGGNNQQSTPTQTPVSFQSNVDEDAKDVPVNTEVTASATDGELTAVKMSYKSKKTGKPIDVPGSLENGSWKAGDLLEPGVTYTMELTGKNSSGSEETKTRTFTTKNLTLDEQTYVKVEPADGQTVGVGMPVIVTFDVPVKDKDNFLKHMSVNTTPSTEGAWRWISDKEVHWRPKDYWKPGTKVKVKADLNGVDAGDGIFGEQDREASFTIGRKVVAETNFDTHQMTFKIDDKVTKTMPITGGKANTQTRSGIKVIMNKQENITMRAETIGYDKNNPEWYPDSKVRYALQLTHSGEFIHTATWSVWAQGRQNVSHGCTGMNTANSGYVFENMKVGDLVVASGTDRKMTLGNGIADWNLSWEDWKSGKDIK